MSENRLHVRTDEHGVMRVGCGRVMLDSVVAAFLEGHSAETIRSQYPSLSLADVYGAIAYYLDHSEEVNEYLRRQGQVWDQFRAECEKKPGAVVERLRALKRAPASEAS